MILLHDTAGNEIAVRVCDISRAVRFPADTDGPDRTLITGSSPAREIDAGLGWRYYTVTETPAEIVAMMRDYAKGWA